MKFKATFCDPFKPDIVDIGAIEKGKIMELFENIPWDELLSKMDSAKEDEIHYSPSLGIENLENKNSLELSVVDGNEWYIFFKRPKQVKRFFGLVERVDDDFLTDISGQSIDDVRTCLKALINNDLAFLEDKIK